ncbi:MAG: Translational regulator CsrA [Legionella sp.]|uniref:carbon storage regulator CsrA n=1 Tax=Legionella sp. TaxID=459 RepID=UPI003D0FF4F3
MLLLTRRIGEAVIIGDNEINVTILAIKGNQVRLGFKASKEIAIHRDEIYNRIQLEKHQANAVQALSIDESIINQLEVKFKKNAHRELAH